MQKLVFTILDTQNQDLEMVINEMRHFYLRTHDQIKSLQKTKADLVLQVEKYNKLKLEEEQYKEQIFKNNGVTKKINSLNHAIDEFHASINKTKID